MRRGSNQPPSGSASQRPSIPAFQRPSVPASSRPSILLTVDVEDWFQVENFKGVIPFSSWDQKELRVERNVHCLLDLFDEMRDFFPEDTKIGKSENPIENTMDDGRSSLSAPDLRLFGSSAPRIRATFFILGWIAKRFPNLVREIQSRGHEIASHGFNHQLCSHLEGDALREDLANSKKLLEDITGHEVRGYRAPSFSVSNEILKVIEDAGYRYDASYNSFDKHGRYGKLSLDGFPKKGIAYQISDSFYELPVSNISYQLSAVSCQSTVLPWSGGGYFRLIPLSLFKLGVQKILKQDRAYHFYCHPWEIDAGQPRVEGLSRTFRFRHYVNIGSTYEKLKKLISTFRTIDFQTLSGYLAELENPKS